MPKIFQYIEFILRFYSNDHLPVQVHVQIQEREIKVKFILEQDEVKLLLESKRKDPLTQKVAKEVSVF